MYIINSHSGLYSGTMTSVVDGITAWLILTNFRRADDDKQLQTLQQSQVSVLVVVTSACWQIFRSDNYKEEISLLHPFHQTFYITAVSVL